MFWSNDLSGLPHLTNPTSFLHFESFICNLELTHEIDFIIEDLFKNNNRPKTESLV